jgi:hypothetical protein
VTLTVERKQSALLVLAEVDARRGVQGVIAERAIGGRGGGGGSGGAGGSGGRGGSSYSWSETTYVGNQSSTRYYSNPGGSSGWSGSSGSSGRSGGKGTDGAVRAHSAVLHRRAAGLTVFCAATAWQHCAGRSRGHRALAHH